MSTQPRPAPGRSDRDKLEKLQEQLRAARARHAELEREKAELLARTAELEEDRYGPRRATETPRGPLERPAPSLPGHLFPPFTVSPALHSPYARLLTALRQMPRSMKSCSHMLLALLVYPRFFLLGAGAMLVALFGVLALVRAPEDGDAFTHWSFDREGFFPVHSGASQGKVLYREIQQVRSTQGWLQRLFGLGSVEVVWTPGAPTSLGSASKHSQRIVKLKLLPEPTRLADWLQWRARAARGEDVGVLHVE